MEDMIKLNFLFYVLIFLSCLYAGMADDTVPAEFKARIEALEKQGKEQGWVLIQQAAALNKLQATVEVQNKRLLIQEDTISEYKEKVQKLELKLAVIENREDKQNEAQIYRDQQEAAEDTFNEHNESSQDLQMAKTGQQPTIKRAERPSRLVLQTEGAVAFHATIRTSEVDHIGINQKIVFPEVLTNLDRNQHGIFTAPVAGVYIFSTSIMSAHISHVVIFVHIMKNGNVLANAYAHGDSGRNDQGSVTVVTQLALGDEVWVSLYGFADTSLWGDNFDSFMGCLIVPL